MDNNRVSKINQNIRIAVAMSGGVDSSVAAALLAEEYGKENVFGVTMRLFCYGGKEVGPKNCCSLDAINDAKAVCKKMGIKHYVLDFEKEFEREVIENFVSEYLKGRTPNPCVRCNSIIKFDYLLAKGQSLGADYLATGHYARIACAQIDTDNKKTTDLHGCKLLKGKDKKKDQSYFLHGLTQEQLKHTLFPLGEFTKDKVRNLAKKYGLKTAEKAESQEICFIASDTDYHGFLKGRIDTEIVKGGDVVDKKGNVLGAHLGLPFYTIGQRRGIDVSYKHEKVANKSLMTTNRKPLYVIGVDVKKNRLIVGGEKELYRKEFEVSDLNLISGKIPEKESKMEVIIRYNMVPAKAQIFPKNKTAKVIFDKPQKSITPGQSAVFYRGEEVLGGGIIAT